MISSLRGKVSRISQNQVEIDVGGVGYSVFMGRHNFIEDQEVKVFTFMAVSENDMSLYGFEKFEDLDLFKMMITVSGVGPKSAAHILASTTGTEIVKAIGDADVEFFKKLKGLV